MEPRVHEAEQATPIKATHVEEKPVAERSLYDRLGGVENIERIVDDLLELHLANPLIAPRFAAVADKETMRRHAVEFFCAGTGGTQHYTGRDMVATHTGMNISEQEFIAVLDDFLTALRRNRVPEAEQTEVLGILYGMKAEILRL